MRLSAHQHRHARRFGGHKRYNIGRVIMSVQPNRIIFARPYFAPDPRGGKRPKASGLSTTGPAYEDRGISSEKIDVPLYVLTELNIVPTTNRNVREIERCNLQS